MCLSFLLTGALVIRARCVMTDGQYVMYGIEEASNQIRV